jgi:tetratricopeptide (TPR) repeat protein
LFCVGVIGASLMRGVMRQTKSEWFRNTTWDAYISQAFEDKLRRARHKEQYLRIQACTLADSHPHVALELLERYFELPNKFDHAQAHVDRARAQLVLNRVDDAIQSYEAALARETEFPNLKTQAYIDLPFLIATRRIASLYERAVRLLDANQDRLTFPVDRFQWHAAYCFVAADSGALAAAKAHATRALELTTVKDSGFRYHPTIGLVTDGYDRVMQALRACLAA